jgi:hypothetical protein
MNSFKYAPALESTAVVDGNEELAHLPCSPWQVVSTKEIWGTAH